MKILVSMVLGLMLVAISVSAKAHSVGGSGSETAHVHPTASSFQNEDFYTDGKFDEEKAKDAIVELMAFHNYPVYPGIREKMWISDYGTGQFSKLGIALVLWVTSTDEDPYMLMDIFLLPNQMLPEHLHADPEGPWPPKAEAWFIRHGKSYIVGEGEDNLANFPIEIPEVHDGGNTTTRHVIEATPGMLVPLLNPRESPKHWQFAGPEGAIITEVASHMNFPGVIYHDDSYNKFLAGE